MRPARVLEIGSYEGRSTCWIIDKLVGVEGAELHCIDLWPYPGGHVERRFKANVQAAISRQNAPKVQAYKGASDAIMGKWLGENRAGYFDFAYIDGNHTAPDVLSDAILAFRLVRVGGYLIFDDYWWTPENDRRSLMGPKPAVDAFTNVYADRVRPLPNLPNDQVYVQKVADRVDHL